MKKRVLAILFLGIFLLGPVDATSSLRIAERAHTRYDADLGWVNIPGLRIADLYGPGLDLRINGQGFRNNRDFPKEVPPGRLRVLCSGDSFTLGYGVGQDEGWCAQLEKMDERLETVNMGQGGYGVDQSYLWFMRDGRALDFDAHVFTFIFIDFERMKLSNFFGYQKPVLELAGDELIARKAGPPNPHAKLSRFMAFRIWLHGFEEIRWLEKQARKYLIRLDDAETRHKVSKIFAALREENEKKGGRLLLVYLPTRMDREATRLDDLRSYLKEESARQGIAFTDLTEKFRALDEPSFDALFLTAENARFAGAEGHYTVAGNHFVARAIHDALAPELE